MQWYATRRCTPTTWMCRPWQRNRCQGRSLADELVERGIIGTVSDSRAESSNERGDAKMNNNTNDLIMVAFPTEAKAEAVGKKLLDIQPEYLIEVEGAVIATKQANGVVEL